MNYAYAICCDSFYQTEPDDFKLYWSENIKKAYRYTSRADAEKALRKGIKDHGLEPKHFKIVRLPDGGGK